MLVQYIRNKKNRRVGVVVALKRKDGTVGIGWSLCHSNLDRYNQEIGLTLAELRAEFAKTQIWKIQAGWSIDAPPDNVYIYSPEAEGKEIPHSAYNLVERMMHRAKFHFKDVCGDDRSKKKDSKKMRKNS